MASTPEPYPTDAFDDELAAWLKEREEKLGHPIPRGDRPMLIHMFYREVHPEVYPEGFFSRTRAHDLEGKGIDER